jgi:alpha-glucosidase (family GH31 glycosyl hydrolase)
MSYPEDPNVTDIGTEYMLGQNLLVSPVTTQGATEWPIYFPASKWYDYWTKKEYEGGKTVNIPVSLDSIPVFVPAGGILVKAPVVPYVDMELKKEFDKIDIEIYSGADGCYRLYEDDGISLGYMRGENTITDICWEDKSKKLSGRGKSTLMSGKNREINVTLYPSGEKRTLEVEYE